MTVFDRNSIDTSVARSDDSLNAAGMELDSQIDRLIATVDLADSRLNGVQKFTETVKDDSPTAIRGESTMAQRVWSSADQVRRATNTLEAIIGRLDL